MLHSQKHQKSLKSSESDTASPLVALRLRHVRLRLLHQVLGTLGALQAGGGLVFRSEKRFAGERRNTSERPKAIPKTAVFGCGSKPMGSHFGVGAPPI